MSKPKLKERVSARMNLNSGAIIVKRRNSEHGEYGETIMETKDPILLRNVEFRVQENAHQKVVDQGTRDVCAYAVGEYIGDSQRQYNILGVDVHYNPFRHSDFHVFHAGELVPVTEAMLLRIWSDEEAGKPVGKMRALGITAKTTL